MNNILDELAKFLQGMDKKDRVKLSAQFFEYKINESIDITKKHMYWAICVAFVALCICIAVVLCEYFNYLS